MQDRYVILGILGQGAMGRVYSALDMRLDIQVAIKELVLDEIEFGKEFRREAKLLANLNHPALPRSSDYFCEGSRCFFVMEFIEGEDLGSQLLKRAKPFGIGEVLEWADQMLDALEYLHEHGVIHRDIKPSNLKIGSRGRLKLLDFGIAKGAIGDYTTITDVSRPAGTKRYAPLEQILKFDADSFAFLSLEFADEADRFAKRSTNSQSDIYAFGATLFHLLTNKAPESAPLRAFSIWSGKDDLMDFTPSFIGSFLAMNLPDYQRVFSILEESMRIEPDERFSSTSALRSILKGGNAVGSPPRVRENVVTAVTSQGNRSDLFDRAREAFPDSILVGDSIRRPAPSELESRNQEGLLNRFTEAIRRAELLGFSDLLDDLKQEKLDLSEASIEKIERMITVEIKISRELELNEAKRNWQRVQEEREEQRAQAFAAKEKLHAKQRSDAEAREKSRVWLLITIVVPIALAVAAIMAVSMWSTIDPANTNKKIANSNSALSDSNSVNNTKPRNR